MIKGTILTAVAVAGIGVAAAEAATVTTERYDLLLRYEGTSFSGVYIDETEYDGFSNSYISHTENNPGLKSTPFSSLHVGDLIDFRAIAIFLDPPIFSSYPVPYANGGSTPVCRLGPVDCTDTATTRQDSGKIYLSYIDEKQISGVPDVGGLISYYYWTRTRGDGGGGYFDDGRYYTFDSESALFTVVSELAPVPLPASAALLPLGLGALAMMRKRRRKVS